MTFKPKGSFSAKDKSLKVALAVLYSQGWLG